VHQIAEFALKSEGFVHETPVLGYKNSDLLKETEDLQQELGDS
jgi:hypothetical protein